MYAELWQDVERFSHWTARNRCGVALFMVQGELFRHVKQGCPFNYGFAGRCIKHERPALGLRPVLGVASVASLLGAKLSCSLSVVKTL